MTTSAQGTTEDRRLTDRFLGVHLVGSLPFESSEEAFAYIDRDLKPWVRRVPDETGDRAAFAATQMPYLFENPQLEKAPPEPPFVGWERVTLRPDVAPADLRFDRFEYADAAKGSFAAFSEAKRQGVLPADARFLFAMPTPVHTLSTYVAARSVADVLPAYELQARAAVEEICADLPADELSFQWDVVIDLAILDGRRQSSVSPQDVLEAASRWGSWVPGEVEMGIHLCYGDANRTQFRPGKPIPETELVPAPKYPEDAGPLAYSGNALLEVIERPIAFLHSVTAPAWTTPRQFAPLGELNLPPDADLFLGLVHPNLEIEAVRQRIAAAGEAIPRPFGISAPCGMGRYSPEAFATASEALRVMAAELDAR